MTLVNGSATEENFCDSTVISKTVCNATLGFYVTELEIKMGIIL